MTCFKLGGICNAFFEIWEYEIIHVSISPPDTSHFIFLVKFSVVGTHNISILIRNSDSCLILIQYSHLFTAQYQPCYHGFAVKEVFYFEASVVCCILLSGTFSTKGL